MNNFNEKCKAFLFELGKKERKSNMELFIKKLGGEFVTINPSYRSVYNPFLAATEQAQTIEEKEIKLRNLLDKLSDYGAEYARQQLSDMSFLDDAPEWKERAIIILNEYANS